MKSPTTYTRFEKARIVGARALQVGMGAPVLIKHDKALQNPVELALLEFENDLIPITVKRSVPPRAAHFAAGLGGDAGNHRHG